MQHTDINEDKGNAQVFLIILVVVLLAVGVIYFVNKGTEKPPTGASTSNTSVNESQSSTPNSVNETMTPDKQTSNQDIDTQLSTLNTEGKDIDTSLNDQPVDVMAQ